MNKKIIRKCKTKNNKLKFIINNKKLDKIYKIKYKEYTKKQINKYYKFYNKRTIKNKYIELY